MVYLDSDGFFKTSEFQFRTSSDFLSSYFFSFLIRVAKIKSAKLKINRLFWLKSRKIGFFKNNKQVDRNQLKNYSFYLNFSYKIIINY